MYRGSTLIKWNSPFPGHNKHTICAARTCLKTISVSVQYLCVCSPPCSSTTAPRGMSLHSLRCSHRRWRLRANSFIGTLRQLGPTRKQGLQLGNKQTNNGNIAFSPEIVNQVVEKVYSRLQKSCNKLNSGKPQLCLNQEEGGAEAGKIIRSIRSKSIVVFHCSVCLLQDFCTHCF